MPHNQTHFDRARPLSSQEPNPSNRARTSHNMEVVTIKLAIKTTTNNKVVRTTDILSTVSKGVTINKVATMLDTIKAATVKHTVSTLPYYLGSLWKYYGDYAVLHSQDTPLHIY